MGQNPLNPLLNAFSKACALPASCQQQSLQLQKNPSLVSSQDPGPESRVSPQCPPPSRVPPGPAGSRLGCGAEGGDTSPCRTGCGSAPSSSRVGGGVCPQPPPAPLLRAPCRGSPDPPVMAVAPFRGHQRLGACLLAPRFSWALRGHCGTASSGGWGPPQRQRWVKPVPPPRTPCTRPTQGKTGSGFLPFPQPQRAADGLTAPPQPGAVSRPGPGAAPRGGGRCPPADTGWHSHSLARRAAIGGGCRRKARGGGCVCGGEDLPPSPPPPPRASPWAGGRGSVGSVAGGLRAGGR